MKTTATKLMVILLSLMMTVSSFITFSFAEDPQIQTQTADPAATAVEITPEPEPAEQPAPEPVKEIVPDPEPVKESTPEPEPEPVITNNSGSGGSGSSDEVKDETPVAQEDQKSEDDGNGKNEEPPAAQDGQDGGQSVPGEVPAGGENKEDEKDKMPAQSFSGSAGGLNVRASAGQGVFPEGTDMNVSGVSSGYVMSAAEDLAGENGTVVDAKAVDITFTKDGREIQPAAGSVKVSLSANGAVDGEEHEAVHISSGSASSMGDASATSASFRADHFSIYGIIGVIYEDENVQRQERHTYNFFVDGNLVDTQTVTDEDTLVEPQVPALASGKVFSRWQVTRVDDTNIYPPYTPPFGKVDIPVGNDHAWADKTFRVDAVFDETYYVTFYKDEGGTSVLRTKAAAKNTEVTTNDVTFDFGNGKAITGWKELKNANAPVDSVIIVTGDIELIPVISDVKWVKFDSNGGTPVAPVYSVGNSAVSEPTPPTRSGFRFAGWFSDPDLKLPYDFRKPVTEDITLYAKWNSTDKVQYTVAYWKQNANDDGYTFVESETGSDYAGESATYSGKDNKYEGFTLNRTKSDVDVIIKGNGTTIKNVYYDRKTYPLTFYIYKKKNLWTPSTWEKVDERYFKYQEDTSAFWHNVTQKYKSYQWFISENSSTSYSYAPPMQPANGSLSGFSGIKAYGRTADYSYTIRYLEEGTDREIKEAFTGKTSKWSIMFTNEDHIIIPGFTFSRESAFDRNRVGTLYYERNTYTLKLFANGGPAPEGGSEYRGIKFEASLAGYSPSNYKAGVTIAVFDGVTKTFAGWYDNQLLDGSPFSFNSTMPALEAVKQTGDKSTLVLYAKWVTDEHTVTFDLNGGTINGASSIEPQVVEGGNTATQPSGEMKRDGFTFGGWEKKDGSLFHFDTIITADTELKAVWHAEGEEDIGVVYDAGDKGVFTGKDTKKYHRNAEAKVLGIPEVMDEYKSQGWYFKGWQVGSSDTLVSRGTFVVIDPGLKVTRDGIEKTLTLTAVYEQKETLTSVTYNSNLPDGRNETFKDNGKIINEDYEVLTFAATKMKDAGDEYEFVCWETAAGQKLPEGKKVAAGRDNGMNELTARWKKKDIPVKVVISGNTKTVTYDGTEQDVTGVTWEVTKAAAVPEKLKAMLLGTKSQEDDLNSAVKVTLKEGRTARAAGTNAGSYDMGLSLDDFVIEVSAGYNLADDPTYNDGSITIEPYSITVGITGNTKTAVVNGTEQSVSGFNARAQGSGHPSTFDIGRVLWKDGRTPEVKGIDPGKYFMGLDAEDFSYLETDGMENFAVSYDVTDGWLEITPAYVDVNVKKEWNDGNNKDKIRPSEVTVVLLVNGDLVPDTMPATLNKDNGWTHTWEKLPKYDGTEEIRYTVEEEAVPAEYTAEVSGSVEKGFTVTNTHTPKPDERKDPVPPADNDNGNGAVLGDYRDDRDGKDTKTADSGKSTAAGGPGPDTGDRNRMFLYTEILSLAVISLIMLIVERRKKEEQEEND